MTIGFKLVAKAPGLAYFKPVSSDALVIHTVSHAWLEICVIPYYDGAPRD